MKLVKFCGYLLFCLFFLLSACQDDKGKNDYSGVGELISDRNKARYEAAKNPPKKSSSSRKAKVNKVDSSKLKTTPKKEEISSIVLYEEDIEVVGSKSGRTLAKGVAYINKKGQIVKIKILKE
ncbi:MAG: hypothetical protein DRH34_07470 [Deltaproteobacteria bacterium]|nr:MAG: hypothetical protein DRH34_07470 [Deltaproteobacteria bacterium]RLC20966.1 MAG: hypothetical protein DRH93_12675 [Deltaproteobacteria bacterium]